MNDIDLAKAWIEMHHAEKGSVAHEANFWAYESLEDLRDSDADRYWDVIKKIMHMDDSEIILANLAAGPVEDILVYLPERFIERIEACAKTDEKFRLMLGMVWKNNIPEAIWERVKRAASGS